MRRVILESPYAGDIGMNTDYARHCLLDSLGRGEAPLASHLLYTQVLRDHIADERAKGIAAGHAWITAADAVVVYTDLGISPGMQAAIDLAGQFNVPVEPRKLPAEVRKQDDPAVPPPLRYGYGGGGGDKR